MCYQQSGRVTHSMSDLQSAQLLADWIGSFPQLVYSRGQVSIKPYFLVLVPNVFFSLHSCNNCLCNGYGKHSIN